MREYILPQLGANELADRIREAIGAGAWEEVRVRFSPHERENGDDPWWFPKDAAELDAIKAAPEWFLRSSGLGLWDRENGIETWLYPWEWYDHIPEGYEVVVITGGREPFQRGVSDNDKRLGCLAYGFSRPAPAPEAQTETRTSEDDDE